MEGADWLEHFELHKFWASTTLDFETNDSNIMFGPFKPTSALYGGVIWYT